MRIKEIVFAIAIMILTIFVTFYGINVLFPSVQYDDYCGNSRVAKVVETEQECIAMDGEWIPSPKECFSEPCPQGYCDSYTKCSAEYDTANQARSQKIFFVALPLAIIIILVGAFGFGLEYVGLGLMGGGVGTLLYGSGALWPYADSLVKFILSLIGLIALIWFAYWANRRSGKKKKRKK